MYTDEQIDLALGVYAETGSASETRRRLGGWPSEDSLRGWAAGRRPGASGPRKEPVYLSPPEKRAAVSRVLAGEGAAEVAASLGVSAASVRGWRRAFSEGGEEALAGPRERSEQMREPTRAELDAMPDDVDELRAELFEARFERDLALQVVEILKTI